MSGYNTRSKQAADSKQVVVNGDRAVNDAIADAIDKISEGVCRRVTETLEKTLSRMLRESRASSTAVASPGYEYRPVSYEEIAQVKRALPQVTWRSCPRGHLYAVGECGSAVVTAVCMECRQPVGR
ncbi:hypothetical protein H4R18_004050 [Coemansia javaensis]|uniref:RZ-type domain-containing protein n=1 Tax=Coemansia javaensis TaxID=2761396 RepID=A0A9W8H8T8_9FUNG|nr:hypothetical protein H4R18_004050 [Coemansia javaensis]